jgi:hypothetical protein
MLLDQENLNKKYKGEIELLKIEYSNNINVLEEKNQKKQYQMNNLHDQNVKQLKEFVEKNNIY